MCGWIRLIVLIIVFECGLVMMFRLLILFLLCWVRWFVMVICWLIYGELRIFCCMVNVFLICFGCCDDFKIFWLYCYLYVCRMLGLL